MAEADEKVGGVTVKAGGRGRKFQTMRIDTKKAGILGGGSVDDAGDCYSPKSPGNMSPMYSPKLVVADPSKKERQLQKLVDPHTIADFYDFGAELGEGGFGSVREITHARTFQPFAGKILRKDHLEQDSGGAMTDESFRQINELLLNTEHPNLLPFVHLFEDDANYYLVMPKCEGGTVHDLCRGLRAEHGGPVTRPLAAEADVKSWLTQMLLGIGYLHGLRVLHRDIKPANALFLDAARTQVVLGDFDMCVKIPGEEPRLPKDGVWPIELVDGKGSILGTGGYQAPEIFTSAKYSKQTDLYAIGASFMHILACQHVFHGEEDGADEDYNWVLLWLKGFIAETQASIADDKKAGLEQMAAEPMSPASPGSPGSPDSPSPPSPSGGMVPRTPLDQKVEFKSEYAGAMPESCKACFSAARNYSVALREALLALVAVDPQDRPRSCQIALQAPFFGFGKNSDVREKKKKNRTARKSQHMSLLNMKDADVEFPDE